jgi:hypothetical protein
LAERGSLNTHDNAAYYFDPIFNKAKGQERYPAAETIAEALTEEGRTVASVQWYMVQNHGTAYDDPEHLFVQPSGDFGRRVDVAIDILNQRPVDSGGTRITVPEIPDLLAVYSSDLDAMRASDKLGDLVTEAQPPYGFALSEPPLGEWRASHGSTQELEVPFLVAGAGFRRDVPPEAPNVVDVAPTIAALLGVSPPDHAGGRVLAEAMAPPSLGPQGAANRGPTQ